MSSLSRLSTQNHGDEVHRTAFFRLRAVKVRPVIDSWRDVVCRDCRAYATLGFADPDLSRRVYGNVHYNTLHVSYHSCIPLLPSSTWRTAVPLCSAFCSRRWSCQNRRERRDAFFVKDPHHSNIVSLIIFIVMIQFNNLIY